MFRTAPGPHEALCPVPAAQAAPGRADRAGHRHLQLPPAAPGPRGCRRRAGRRSGRRIARVRRTTQGEVRAGPAASHPARPLSGAGGHVRSRLFVPPQHAGRLADRRPASGHVAADARRGGRRVRAGHRAGHHGGTARAPAGGCPGVGAGASRLRHPHLLDRPHDDPGVLGAARVAAVQRHADHRGGPGGLGVVGGRGTPSGAARGDAFPVLPRAVHAAHAGLHAGGVRAGLRHDRARERSGRAQGRVPARVPQRAAAHGDNAGAAGRLHAGRFRAGGDGVRLAGPGTSGIRSGVPARSQSAAGHPAHVVAAGGRGQSGRRSRLRAAGPQDRTRVKAFLARFIRNVPALAGAVVLLAIVVMALTAPVLYPGDPWDMVAEPFLAPGADAAHPLGSDMMGRDLAAGIFHGARVSLVIGVVATGVALLLGVTIGALAGYFGGWIDDVLMRLTELFQTIPAFLFAIVLVAIFKPTVTTIVLAIGVVSWPPVARLTRGEFLSLRSREFVQACIAMGMGDLRIIALHCLPNALAPIIVTGSLMVATAILTEAGLAFLGLGDPNVMSWGTIIGAGREVLRTAWYVCALPGLAILLTVLAINLVGEGVNDALNPRLRNR
ncbi:MAG: ABC transporter permease [Betaproteobacteria bacterium]|nr:ABC transporter permease [Betaproteobacteria bacterium]